MRYLTNGLFWQSLTGFLTGVCAPLIVLAVATGCGPTGDSVTQDDPGFVSSPPVCDGTWTGGTVVDTSEGALIVPGGVVSPCSGITQPPTVEVGTALPTAFPIDTSIETVVSGDGDKRTISTGGNGFNISPGNYVTIIIPIDSTRIPTGSVANSVNTFVRVWDPDRDVATDLHGKLDLVAGTITVNLIGLPSTAIATVLFRPGRMATTADAPLMAATFPRIATDVPPWQGRDWCVIYDSDSFELRSAIQTIEGLGQEPDLSTISASIRTRVANAARAAQQTYEGLGLRAPWLYVSEDPEGPCGETLGTTPRYEVHVIDTKGSHYNFQDPDEATGPDDRHYGRIYIKASRIGDGPTTNLGTVRASVAHEMAHAVQMGYEILNSSTIGLCEGTATVAGVYVDSGGSIAVRKGNPVEVFRMPFFLMTTGDGIMYSNQDFVAFAARRYSGYQLAFLPVVFGAMRDQIEASASMELTTAAAAGVRAQPGVPAVHRALDSVFKYLTVNLGLREAYLDFLTQRTFFHGTDSQFSRDGETYSGFAPELFSEGAGTWGNVRELTASMSTCDMSNGRVDLEKLCPFSARAVRIAATDIASPARKATLQVDLTTMATNEIVAYAWRNGEMQGLEGSLTFADFGAVAGDEIVLLVADAAFGEDCNTKASLNISLTCDEPPPQGEDPMKCGSSGIPACNDVPAEFYWRRACEEYTGSHWALDWGTLQNMCGYTTNAEWCNSGCSRSNILGTCSMSFGENADVVFYYYTTVDYAAQGFDPIASCAEDGGSWN